MGMNFPNAPLPGEIYPVPAVPETPQYRWNGFTWNALSPVGGSGSSIYVSDTVPPSAPDKSLWWKSDVGKMLLKYNDGDSTQWAEAVAIPAPDMTWAAPFDAMAFSGMQINGSMEVSQELGTAGLSVLTGTEKYIADGWKVAAGGQTVVGALNTATLPIGFLYALQIFPATANPSPAAGHYAQVAQYIEGCRVVRLGWGTASAQPITIGFWAYAFRAGTYSGAVNNATFDRSYAFPFTINSAGIWEYKTVTIPGDVTGVWRKDTGIGMTIRFCLMVGTTFQTAPGGWIAGGFMGATGSINGAQTTSDTLLITGVVVLPGTAAPTAAQSSRIMRPYDQELLTCQRYYEQLEGNISIGAGMAAAGGAYAHINFMRKRALPTIATVNPSQFSVYNASGAGMAATISGSISIGLTSALVYTSAVAGLVNGNGTTLYSTGGKITLDARL